MDKEGPPPRCNLLRVCLMRKERISNRFRCKFIVHFPFLLTKYLVHGKTAIACSIHSNKTVQELGELSQVTLNVIKRSKTLAAHNTGENYLETQSGRCHGTKLCPVFPAALSVSPTRPDTLLQHADAGRTPGFSCTLGHNAQGARGQRSSRIFEISMLVAVDLNFMHPSHRNKYVCTSKRETLQLSSTRTITLHKATYSRKSSVDQK